MTGASVAALARWADKGLLTCFRMGTDKGGEGSGPRRYWRHEIDIIVVATIICQIDRPDSRFVEFVYRSAATTRGPTKPRKATPGDDRDSLPNELDNRYERWLRDLPAPPPKQVNARPAPGAGTRRAATTLIRRLTTGSRT
ncbi:hypothetical protein [Actinomadura craniellae]|nr:hypothetical protein [Actinomadura craniellae]